MENVTSSVNQPACDNWFITINKNSNRVDQAGQQLDVGLST